MQLFITDIFRFKGGRVVFTVSPEKTMDNIPSGWYDLYMNGLRIQNIRLNTDMITNYSGSGSECRISTVETVLIPDDINCETADIVLRSSAGCQ